MRLLKKQWATLLFPKHLAFWEVGFQMSTINALVHLTLMTFTMGAGTNSWMAGFKEYMLQQLTAGVPARRRMLSVCAFDIVARRECARVFVWLYVGVGTVVSQFWQVCEV